MIMTELDKYSLTVFLLPPYHLVQPAPLLITWEGMGFVYPYDALFGSQ